MKIAVSSSGNNLESAVDPRFGRCAWFLFVDSDTLEFEAVSNEAAASAQGAGIMAAQTVLERKPDVVITGNMGPNAWKVLQAADLPIYGACAGKVKEAIAKLNSGDLTKLFEANVPEKAGRRAADGADTTIPRAFTVPLGGQDRGMGLGSGPGRGHRAGGQGVSRGGRGFGRGGR